MGVLAKATVRLGEGAGLVGSVKRASGAGVEEACACLFLLDVDGDGVTATMKAPLIGPGQQVRESMHR